MTMVVGMRRCVALMAVFNRSSGKRGQGSCARIWCSAMKMTVSTSNLSREIKLLTGPCQRVSLDPKEEGGG